MADEVYIGTLRINQQDASPHHIIAAPAAIVPTADTVPLIAGRVRRLVVRVGVVVELEGTAACAGEEVSSLSSNFLLTPVAPSFF